MGVSLVATPYLTLYTPVAVPALSSSHAPSCHARSAWLPYTYPPRLSSGVTSSGKPHGHDLLACPLMTVDNALVLAPKGYGLHS